MSLTLIDNIYKKWKDIKEYADSRIQFASLSIKNNIETLIQPAIDSLQRALDKKQDKLKAGENITISGNTISAKGGETYKAGENIMISKQEISVIGYKLNPGFAEMSKADCYIRKLTQSEIDNLISLGYDYYNYIETQDNLQDESIGWIIVGDKTYKVLRSEYTDEMGGVDLFYVDDTIEGVDENNEYLAVYVYDINNALGEYSHAEGSQTVASGYTSHTEGQSTSASGQGSHAEGSTTVASGYTSHTEGYHTAASGDSSHAEGYTTEAKGVGSHTEGRFTQASGDSSHAEGYISRATNSNFSSNTLAANSNTSNGCMCHAEGNATIAQGYNSHAEGKKTFAKGPISHAEGEGTTSSGYASHSEGENTTASNYCSHAEGSVTTASGPRSHSEGNYTITMNTSEHAEGSYNSSHKASDTYGDAGNTQHSVGIGDDGNNRKNAFEIMQNGDVYVIGIGGYDGTNPESAQTLQQVLASLVPSA